MIIYPLPGNPATSTMRLSSLRARAKRRGYAIGYEKHTDTWTLIDTRLRRPLVGFENVGLTDIARAILALPTPKTNQKARAFDVASRRREAACNRLLGKVAEIGCRQ